MPAAVLSRSDRRQPGLRAGNCALAPGGFSRSGFSLLELQVAFALLALALVGIAPLAVLQSRQAQKLQEKISPDNLYYLVPSEVQWARALGAQASLVQQRPPTIQLATSGCINFQRFGDPAPGAFGGKTYLPDGGEPYGTRASGYVYGWTGDNTAGGVRRNSANSADLRYDTFCHMQKFGNHSWEIAVPNGAYLVHVVCGDATATDSVFLVNVEGLPVVVGVPTFLKRWFEGALVVLVLDGKLTVSNGLTAVNNKICYLTFTPATLPIEVRLQSMQQSMLTDAFSAEITLRKK